MNKFILFFSLLYFICQNSFGQTKNFVEILKNKLNKEENDTNKVHLMSNLSGVYRLLNLDSSTLYAQKAFTLAKALNYPKGEVISLGNSSMALTQTGNFPAALSDGLKAINIADNYNIKAEKSIVLSAMGQIYMELKDYKTAIQYSKEMYNLGKSNDKIGFAYSELDLGLEYFYLNRLDSSSFYINRSIKDFEKAKDRIEPLNFLILGNIEFNKGNMPKALAYFHKGLEISIKNMETRTASSAYINLARYYFKKQRTDSAILYSQKGLTIAKKLSLRPVILEATTLLSQLYEPFDTKRALLYHKMAFALSDSLFGSFNTHALQTIIRQDEDRKKEIANSKEAYQNRLKLFAFFASLIILLLIIIIIYWNFLQKKKGNESLKIALSNLTSAQKELEFKNWDLNMEAALEKIRIRAMSMQKSDELGEVIEVLFEKMRYLGGSPFICGIALCQLDTSMDEFWLSSSPSTPTHFFLPHTIDPTQKRMYEGWIKGYGYYTEELGGEPLKRHLEYFRYIDPIRPRMDDLDRVESAPVWQKYNVAYFSYGYLLSITKENINLESLLKRFATVFEQCYTRFLDLKKAEAQSVESNKQASMDRIRAEIASMRKTLDLKKIIPLIWQELSVLNIPFNLCGLILVDEENNKFQTFLSKANGLSAGPFQWSFKEDGFLNDLTRHWKEQKEMSLISSYNDFIAFDPNLNHLENAELPSSMVFQFFPFLQGIILVAYLDHFIPEQKRIIASITDAFSSAYARYEDFMKLENAKYQIENTLSELKTTQDQLIQSEKMASMGLLTAGIAHEIQNPLNFINNFTEVNIELLEEFEIEIKSGEINDSTTILNDVRENLIKIKNHGKRADAIVKEMLLHSRKGSGEMEPTDLNLLIDNCLKIFFNDLYINEKSLLKGLVTNYDPRIQKIKIIPQDFNRVLISLLNNSIYAIQQKQLKSDLDFIPSLVIETKNAENYLEVKIKDNGTGIPPENMDKIFQPFFTTKPPGQGIGLGLSLSYAIIGSYQGKIEVQSIENEGTEFLILMKAN